MLKELGLTQKEEEVIQQIPTAERTGAVIEPLPKLQWFIEVNKKFPLKGEGIDGFKKGDMVSLKDLMKKVVETGQIKIIPDFETKKYFHWIDNLQDWCISRQIWFGHRIPVWYKEGGDMYSGDTPPLGGEWKQDEDTLDTWFSAGILTFSSLGWTGNEKNAPDLELFHPTDVIETAYEILFFWVARMILMTTYTLGEIPFKTIYLHGILRDSKGQKLSKSLGNGGDPIEYSEKFGTDAVRMSLVVGAAPGLDGKLSDDKIKAYKHFANKLWNITRFILTNVGEYKKSENFLNFESNDKELLHEANSLVMEITREIQEYKFHIASEKIYGYVWHRFADVILEESKQILQSPNQEIVISRKQTLLEILDIVLKITHPFMPFVTEEIWQTINSERDMLMIQKWPQ